MKEEGQASGPRWQRGTAERQLNVYHVPVQRHSNAQLLGVPAPLWVRCAGSWGSRGRDTENNRPGQSKSSGSRWPINQKFLRKQPCALQKQWLLVVAVTTQRP